YPSDSLQLSKMMDDFLKKAEESDLKGDVIALWVPHAGYPFSGGVAAHAFKQLQGRSYETVIVVGPSHRHYFEGISVYERGYYKTPLGLVPIDTVIVKQLNAAGKNIYYRPEAHASEHCIEVELPFLQKTIGSFRLVPVIFGNASIQDIKDFGEALTRVLGTQARLLVVSADLSHYHPYKKAREMDMAGLEAIQNLDALDLAEKINNKQTELDAPGAAMAMIRAVTSLGAEKAHLLKYANSGDVRGEKSRVVGYAALAVTLPSWVGAVLKPAEEKELMLIARESIEAVVLGKTLPQFDPKHHALKRNCGAFVTINKHGMLRGCIGYVLPTMPLYIAVSQAAISAATRDVRFPPLSASELEEIDLEISVLTPPRLIEDTTDIKVGTDGLIVRKGNRSGLLLPQVASARNWDRITFLQETCRKAGLPGDSWKSGAQVYAFSARVFGEHRKGR
ncbi:MAG: AmmeMemoRadiSam system protein B, partial [bacterium]